MLKDNVAAKSIVSVEVLKCMDKLFFIRCVAIFNLVVSGAVTINDSPDLKEHDICGYTFHLYQ